MHSIFCIVKWKHSKKKVSRKKERIEEVGEALIVPAVQEPIESALQYF